jgi:hypothetical protein
MTDRPEAAANRSAHSLLPDRAGPVTSTTRDHPDPEV